MTYSQNNEQEIIIEHAPIKGTLLSVGENEGTFLSNVRQLILNGYTAFLVEPAATPYKKLAELYKDNGMVWTFNVAIAEKNGTQTFYESGEHLGKGDTGLLSTLDPNEKERWVGTEFIETKVECWDFKTLLSHCPVQTFDVISIDAEAKDYAILSQMNLTELGCKVLIVETNSIEDFKYVDYCKNFGMRLVLKNAENLIFVK